MRAPRFLTFLSIVLFSAPALGGDDIRVNEDTGASVQSETSIAVSPDGGFVCAAWNDGSEESGFGVSADGGATFADQGPFPSEAAGDPTLAYRQEDSKFYYAAISTTQVIGLWKSADDCVTFTDAGQIILSGDKPMMAIDNYQLDPNDPNDNSHPGRIYVGWTFLGGSAQTRYTDDGGDTFSIPATLPNPGGNLPIGLWPAVAPNGDVYFALLDQNFADFSPQATLDLRIYRSTDGGKAGSWERKTDIGTAKLRPHSAEVSEDCVHPSLNGFIRYQVFPQIAIHAEPGAPVEDYVIHAVYAYDSDGEDPAGPDNSNVFYRRSTDGADSWETEVKLNEDSTTTDQWSPALAVSADGLVVVSWYDRRLDPLDNLKFDRFFRASHDGGATWGNEVRISDVTSLLADTAVPGCYHGDYDQIAIDSSNVVHVIWGDDRRIVGAEQVPDIYYDQVIDTDGDGILDPDDSCPTVANATPADVDNDGVDDACDTCVVSTNPNDYCYGANAPDCAVNPALADPTSVDEDFPNGWMTLTSGQRDDDGDGIGNWCDFKYSGNTEPLIGAEDVDDMQDSVFKHRDGTDGDCGDIPPPPAVQDKVCGQFDHDGLGILVAPFDVSLLNQRVSFANGPSCGTACDPLAAPLGLSGPIGSEDEEVGKAICVGPECDYGP